jgi:alanine dehydrogenase
MSKSPFSRAELLPQEERLWVNHSEERLIVSFAKASTLQERRVAITPEGVKQLCQLGHEIIIEKNLGLHAGYDNRSYSEAGAEVTADNKRVFGSPFIVKIDPFTIEEIEKIPVGCTLLSALQIKTKDKAYFEKLLEKKLRLLV